MKMTVKRSYLFELRSIFANADKIFGNPIPSKVRYAFSVNMKRCNEEAKEIDEGFPEDEKWVDVSEPKWQSFILDDLAPSILDKGVDGLFIDNVDGRKMAYSRSRWKS